jgi:ATP-dependent exoDNAse (exonuclease V) beta subunit
MNGQKANAARVRRREAPEIAQAIKAIRSQQWRIGDGTPEGTRAARYADITILLPARTALPPLERALEDADVPFRVESQSLLYATQEVRDLISILAAIDDPTDQVAVVAALRSPAFACSDAMLEEYARAGGRWDYRATARAEEALPPGHPVVESLAALHELHDGRWFETVSGLVEQVIRERRLFEVAFARRRPRETWQRLRFVQERARAFVDGGGATLRQFVAWLRAQAETESRVVESVVPESDDDAVRIMTVHAAKGLEFPIVILAGLNTKPVERYPSVIWDAEQRPHVRIGRKDAGFETLGYEPARKHESEMDKLEKDRLLYVAATRARDHLIVSLHHNVETRDCHAARLEALRGGRESWQPEEAPDDRTESTTTGTSFEDTPEARERWLAERAERLERSRKAPVLAATAIAHGARGAAEAEAEKPEQEDEAGPWRRGRAGTSIGRAVHAVLQSIDLANPGDGLRETVNAQALAEGVSGRENEIVALVQSALDSNAVQEAVASGKYWREVYLAAPIGETLVEGFIDLLYEGPDGLVVVDYKTDAARTDAERDIAVERYRLQGAAYALAVESALKRKVARCVFVFAKRGGAHERPVEDLPGAIAEVRRFVTGGMAGEVADEVAAAPVVPVAEMDVTVRQLPLL